jgi:hypothetical protein
MRNLSTRHYGRKTKSQEALWAIVQREYSRADGYCAWNNPAFRKAWNEWQAVFAPDNQANQGIVVDFRHRRGRR